MIVWLSSHSPCECWNMTINLTTATAFQIHYNSTLSPSQCYIKQVERICHSIRPDSTIGWQFSPIMIFMKRHSSNWCNKCYNLTFFVHITPFNWYWTLHSLMELMFPAIPSENIHRNHTWSYKILNATLTFSPWTKFISWWPIITAVSNDFMSRFYVHHSNRN
jgi:hypothetical protein